MGIKYGPRPLSKLIGNVIQDWGVEGKLNEVRAIETWATLAGPQINAVTDTAWMKDGILFVRITSAAWRHELHLNRVDWCNRVNEQLGSRFVKEICFR